MPEVARVDDKTECPKMTLFIIPHVGGPLSNASPVHMKADGRPIIRLGDYGHCHFPAPRDVVFEGAATVTVCGLPVARRGDHMAHTGRIIEGSPTFVVGGPAFSVPSNIKIKGPASFRNKVIRDMYMISTTESGKQLLDGIERSGKSVSIEPESDPHNSFCRPISGDAYNGKGSDSIVSYNPDVAVFLRTDDKSLIDAPPQTVLMHELVHAYHNAYGNNATNAPDPNGPPTEKNIPREEAQTIGVGSYEDSHPSENDFREELGLPHRADHWGTGKSNGRELTSPTADLRPGNC